MIDTRGQHNWCLLIGTNAVENQYNFKCTRCGEADSLELDDDDDGTQLNEKLKPGPCTRIRPLAGRDK
jgi:hypothetical protein